MSLKDIGEGYKGGLGGRKENKFNRLEILGLETYVSLTKRSFRV